MANITADQLLEAFEQMTVLELSEFKKKFEDRFGVTAAAPVAAAAVSAGAAEVAAPVARDAAGARSLDLVLPSAGSGRIDLMLPEAGAELAVTPAMAVEARPEPGKPGTRVRAVVGGQGLVHLSWRAPVAAAAGELSSCARRGSG